MAGAHFGGMGTALMGLLAGLSLLWLAAEKDRRYRTGYLFAVAYFLPLTHWLGHFVGRFTASPLLGIFVWLLVAGLLAVPLAVIVPVAHRSFASGRAWVVPLVWLALELFRSYVPVFAFPWGLVAHPLVSVARFVNLAPWLTEFGYGALIVGLSVALCRWPAMKPRVRVAVTTTGALLIGFGTVRGVLLQTRAAADDALAQDRVNLLRVAGFQPGIDMGFGDPNLTPVLARKAIMEAAELGADLVVLPEGLLSVRSEADYPQLAGTNRVLITGGQRRDGKVAYQTAFAYDGRWQWADKTRLVIFGEFVPGRGIIPYPESFHLPGGDLAAGETLHTLDVKTRRGTVRVGPILCFEALFPDIALRQKAAGAELMTVMSLDDWFAGTHAPQWLAQAAVWRALETDRRVVRVGSMGLTWMIRRDGTIVDRLPWGKSGVVYADF